MNLAAALVLHDGDRAQLEALTQSPCVPAGQAQRAQIVLLAADGLANTEIARLAGTSRPTVLKWRQRYQTHGLAGLDDGRRPGRPAAISEIDLLAETLADCGNPPADLGVANWSARLMADQLGISFASVARIWRKHDIQPHRTDMFTFATTPPLGAGIRAVVGLYLSQHTGAMVVSADQTSAHIGHGSTNLMATLESAVEKVGTREGDTSDTLAEFGDFLDAVRAADRRQTLRVIYHNHVTHMRPEVPSWRDRNPGVTMHGTPSTRSWLRTAGIIFGITTRQALRRGLRAVGHLEDSLRTYIDTDPGLGAPFAWVRAEDSAPEMSAVNVFTTHGPDGHHKLPQP